MIHQSVVRTWSTLYSRARLGTGTKSWFERLRGQVKKKQMTFKVITYFPQWVLFRDPAIAKGQCAMILTDEFDNRESIAILLRGFFLSSDARHCLRLCQTELGRPVDKLPTDSGAFLPFIARHYCDAQPPKRCRSFLQRPIDQSCWGTAKILAKY